MQSATTSPNRPGWLPPLNSDLTKRTALLFLNFFLIILAYYQVKGASRSLLIEYWGSKNIPYVWILSALVLTAFIGFYHRLVERHSRLNIVLGSCLLFVALMVAFWVAFGAGVGVAAVGFYIFVDILSVILVEQMWSLTNTITSSLDGRRTYWLVAAGGPVGGLFGGALAATLLEWTPMTTPDLLLSCALMLALILILNLVMGKIGLYQEIESSGEPVIGKGDWRELVTNRYILLIAAALLCAQLAQPVVEYQFLAMVEATYEATDQRTIYINKFWAVLNLVSIGVLFFITPFIHRYLGTIGGLLVQPIILAASSLMFMAQSTLFAASVMKIGDRGLSYSINRASKEQLYIPVDPIHTYQAKAWIDMLGYRVFKVASSALILFFIPIFTVAEMGWLTLAICGIWVFIIALLAREYISYTAAPAVAVE